MAPPSKNFTIIADSAIDADSPITADLMEDFRDNDIHLEEWLGLSYTAAQDHDHDGTNSAKVALNAHIAQYTADLSSGTWNITTGALSITPQAMVINWAFDTGAIMVWGSGFAKGTGASNQNGSSIAWNTTTNTIDYVSMDVNEVMGYTFGAAGTLSTSFVTEQAAVTAWGTSAVTITTQSGAWTGGAVTIYINLQIWGV
jgi:hypothetical protein